MRKADGGYSLMPRSAGARWYFQEDPTGRIDPDCDLGNFQVVNMAQVEPVVGTLLHDL